MFYSEQKKQVSLYNRRTFILFLLKISLFSALGWRLYDIQINNSSKYKTLSKSKAQFIAVGYYILKNSKLRQKLKEYYQNQNDIHTSVYLKESWSSFKPLQENSIIININKQVNENFKNLNLALKEKGEISYENISSIKKPSFKRARSFNRLFTIIHRC